MLLLWFIFSGILGTIVVIGFSIADILKSKEKETKEIKLGLTNKIAFYEKEITELKKKLEKLG